MDKLTISSDAIDNIQDLADHLKKISVRLEVDYSNSNLVKFDMGRFINDASFVTDNICHSSACAVGHYAIMCGCDYNDKGINPDSEDFVDWGSFSEDFIGISQCGDEEVIWDWLFSCKWESSDNTPLGAVARIEHFLEHGVPKDFYTSATAPDAENPESWHRQYGNHAISFYLPRRQALEAECLAAKEALDLTDGATRG